MMGMKKSKSKKNKGLMVRAGGKLPKSKLKLTYAGMVAVLVLSIFGFGAYQYFGYRNYVRSVNAVLDAGGGGGGGYRSFTDQWGLANILICKRAAYGTKYGILVPMVATVFRQRRADQVGQVQMIGWRKQQYSNAYDPLFGKIAQGWYFDAILKMDIPVSYNLLDKTSVATYNRNASGGWQKVYETPQLNLGDVPFCPAGV
jgi:hypothetical protein